MSRHVAITRRSFLRRGAAAAAAAALAPATGATGASTAAQGRVQTIDTHTHFFDPTRPQGVPWPPENDPLRKPHLPAQFQALTARHGVVGTVVLEASPWVEDNQWVLELAKENPIIVGFVGNLQLGVPEFAAHLKRFGANPLFRGLRLSGRTVAESLGRESFVNDLRRLAERGLTLDLVGGAAMLPAVARVARLVPELTIVIDHLPFPDWDGQAAAARRALGEVARRPNVYAKVSAVVRRREGRVVEEPEFYRPGLDVLWELFGPDRAMFGSNWPVSDHVAPYATVHRVVAGYFGAKGRPAAEKFFWRNSLAAYRWRPRGAAATLAKSAATKG